MPSASFQRCSVRGSTPLRAQAGDYLRRAIENRVEQDRGAHLVAAVSLMLGVVLKMQDEVAPVVQVVNTALAEAGAPVRVSLRQ